MLANVNKIISINAYKIVADFNHGEMREIDLSNFINKFNQGTTAQLKDIALFSKVKCNGTTIYWENLLPYIDYDGSQKMCELDLDPNVLYELRKPISE
ncbi:MAG: DUF2442 domain-containing protein [Bacteroidota bacterium]|nr:DUF2442 domain-containing protein [Bacteroidota bacterium]